MTPRHKAVTPKVARETLLASELRPDHSIIEAHRVERVAYEGNEIVVLCDDGRERRYKPDDGVPVL